MSTANVPDIQLALVINGRTIPTFEVDDATAQYIQFYPSATFTIHMAISSEFCFLADILVLSITIGGTTACTFHIRRKAAGEMLEGIIRSTALVFPSETHDHGHIIARLFHASLGDPQGERNPSAQLSEARFESVVDASFPKSKGLRAVPLEYHRQQMLTFKWNYRSLGALQQVVKGARLQDGPAWTEEDEVYRRRQIGRTGQKELEKNDNMLRRLQLGDKSSGKTDCGGGGTSSGGVEGDTEGGNNEQGGSEMNRTSGVQVLDAGGLKK